MQPNKPVDSVPLPISSCPSADVEAFAEHIQKIHADVRQKIATSNASYKIQAYPHRRHLKFEVGDQVMVCIRFAGHIKSFKRLMQMHIVDLPSDLGISKIFNV